VHFERPNIQTERQYKVECWYGHSDEYAAGFSYVARRAGDCAMTDAEGVQTLLAPARHLANVRRALLVLGFAALFTASPALPFVEIDADTARRVGAGEIIVTVSAAPEGGGQVSAVLDVPTSKRRLWEVMLDCQRSVRIVENLKSCTVTSSDPSGHWDVREHVVAWGWFALTVRTVFRSDYAAYDSIRFSKVGGDLKSLRGAWRLEMVDGDRRTRLHYEAVVDPGVPVPGFIVRSAIEADARKTLSALRKEASGK
jgi:Polyketide cyclase / dehydrase and lipid transport